MLGRYRDPVARATGAGAPVARGGERSEAITRAQLQPPGAVCDAERSVATPAAKVLVVEHVEHLERQVRSLRPPRGQLLPERHVYDPVPHHGVALHVWGRVAGVIGREPEVETEQVAADLGALGPGIRDSRAPVRRR